jgi:serine/threonine protein kinase
MKALV